VARTVPASLLEVPGNTITSAWQNAQVKALCDFLTAVPVFSGYQTATQSILNSTFTSFTIDTTVIDTDGGHSNTVNPSRYTATVPGNYLVIGTSAWAASNAGYRRTRIALNGNAQHGATGFDQNQVVTSAGLAISLLPMNGTTDYVEVQGAQNSGGALNTVSASDFCPSLVVCWLRS
jgi:hypothetical protein